LFGRMHAANLPCPVSPIVRAHAFSRAAFFTMFLDDAATTTAYGKQAVAAAETALAESAGRAGLNGSHGDAAKQALIIALGAYSSGARVSRDFHSAYAIGERMIVLLREGPPQSFLLCMALISMGSIAIELGDYADALVYTLEGLELAQSDGDPFRTAHSLNILGDLARCEQSYAEAAVYYERSVAILRELTAQRDLAANLRNLGYACLRLDEIERAHALFQESITIQQTLGNVPGVAECLLGFAAVAILRGLPAAGARLLAAFGAVSGPRFVVATAWRATRMEYEHYLEQARAELGQPLFLKEQALGQALSMEQAVPFALNLPVFTGSISSSQDNFGHLTRRECEVAALIARGKTNHEIAGELVLSTRTVEKHAGNILAKLGLTSRAQIVRWAMQHDLK